MFVGMLFVVAVAWHLAFQRGTAPPDRLAAPVTSAATIDWIDGADAIINLGLDSDEATSLGVAHALGRPWLMALYRQAALGRLSEWFGSQTLALDREVRRMGLPDVDASTLDPAAVRFLEAYADGVRAGQAARPWRLLPAAVSLDLDPEPWTVGHTLAVERLLVWLSTDIERNVPADSSGATASAPDTPSVPPAAPRGSFTAARDSLAAFLGLADLTQSAVWATEAGGLYARLPVGFSAIPPVMTVSVRAGSGLVYEGATWPGLPYRVCGRTPEASWCKPLAGAASIAPDSSAVPPEYFGVNLPDGSRIVGTRVRSQGGLLREGERLAWSGFERGTDAPAWARLTTDPAAGFVGFGLASKAGIHLSQSVARPLEPWNQAGSVLGSGSAREMGILLARVDAVDDTLSSAPALLLDTGSVPPTDSTAGAASAGFEPQVSDSESYLRNWDGSFSGSSIAATLFDARRAFGEAAEDSLLLWFGSDRRAWRWELDPLLVLSYPAAQAAGLPVRYGPVRWLRNGYPGSPAWGPYRAGEAHRSVPFSAAWEASLAAPGSPMDEIRYRRPAVDYNRFLGRSRAEPVRPELLTLTERGRGGRTVIRPTAQ